MRLRPIGLSIFILGLIGCGHGIDSPRPSVSGVNPDLVCNAQLSTAVTLSGMNFTPLSEKSLTGQEVLQLPQVSLTEATELTGAAATGPSVVINPQPADPSSTHVRWESEMQLQFDVTPDLMLSPGVYDITTTNADGHGATKSQSLAVVPPPSVISANPANVCDAQSDDLVTISGQNFLSIEDGSGIGMVPSVVILQNGTPILTLVPTVSGCTPIATQVRSGIALCTTLTVTIPKDSLPPGSYTLEVTNPASANCMSTESIAFVVEPPPKISSVLPTHVCAGGGSLDVKGMDFLPGATVTLRDPASNMSLDAGTVVVSSDGTDAAASFGGGFTVGNKLDLTLTNKDGCTDTLPQAVSVSPGPIVFYVDPPFVYSGMTTPATIYTTGVAGLSAAGAIVLTPSGATTPQTDLTASSIIDPQHPKHIIVDIPQAMTAGVYDLTVTDATGCPAFYPKAITVVTQKTDLKEMTPPFGDDAANTDVTIDATAPFFQAGVRAYLAPHGGQTVLATQLKAVTPVNLGGTPPTTDRVTAVVPASPSRKLPDGLYDLVTVNPDGTIGFLDSAYTSEPTSPPVITSVSPGGIVSNCAGSACDVTLLGENFAVTSGSTPAPVTLDCVLPGTNMHMTYTPTFDSATSTSIKFTVPAGSIPQGNVCVPTVHDSVGDQMFATGGTLAILQPSFNIDSVLSGPSLNTARRAPAVVESGPTLAARFVYAIGGDTGALSGGLPTTPVTTVEFASQDLASGIDAWKILPAQSNLPAPGVTLAGVASVGRFIYLIGGHDGTGSLDKVLRAEVLRPTDAPQLNDADLTPDVNDGLSPGLYYYRIAAVLNSSDANNPGGETLASDEFAVNVPSFANRKIQVTLSWAGGPNNVHHWRIYRTSAANASPLGEDVVYVTADAASTSFIDKGATLTPFVPAAPLPLGALGTWATETAMAAHRAGAGVAVAVDQTANVHRAYLYVGFGFDSTATGPAQFPGSYEYLAIDTDTGLPAGNAWAGGPILDGFTAAAGRWLGGAWAVTSDLDSSACDVGGSCQEYVFFGTGAASTNAASAATNTMQPVEVGLITQGAVGGALASFGPAQPSTRFYGYGALSATNSLFAIGGSNGGGTTTKLNADALVAPANALSTPTLSQMTWGPQGSGQLGAARFLPGVALGLPFFYTVGGSASVGGAAAVETFYNLF
jgi:hypothetical protein